MRASWLLLVVLVGGARVQQAFAQPAALTSTCPSPGVLKKALKLTSHDIIDPVACVRGTFPKPGVFVLARVEIAQKGGSDSFVARLVLDDSGRVIARDTVSTSQGGMSRTGADKIEATDLDLDGTDEIVLTMSEDRDGDGGVDVIGVTKGKVRTLGGFPWLQSNENRIAMADQGADAAVSCKASYSIVQDGVGPLIAITRTLTKGAKPLAEDQQIIDGCTSGPEYRRLTTSGLDTVTPGALVGPEVKCGEAEWQPLVTSIETYCKPLTKKDAVASCDAVLSLVRSCPRPSESFDESYKYSVPRSDLRKKTYTIVLPTSDMSGFEVAFSAGKVAKITYRSE